MQSLQERVGDADRMKPVKDVQAEIRRLEKQIDVAEAEERSRTEAGTVGVYWLEPVADVSRLRGRVEGLKWVLQG